MRGRRVRGRDAPRQPDRIPRVAWIELKGFGERLALFPTGFTADFAPELEVRDPTGTVVFHEGDKIDGGCGGGERGILIGWP